MATLKCLACGHDNNVGDEWCSSCSSSLNLRLCSACEAINANDAERCHSCNAQFLVEPEVAEPVAVELDLRPGADAGAEPPVYEFLPAPWRMPEEPVRNRRRTFAAALAVLPVLAAGAAYYLYAGSQAAPQAPQVAPKAAAVQKFEPAPDPEAAPKEPARPQTADVKPAQAPAVSGRITAPRTAAAPARSTPPSEPKRTAAAVTHTRGAGAEASSRPAAADAPAKTAATTLPVPTTLPVSVTSAPAASGRILTVSESPPAIPDARRTSVTHTKADLTESAGTTAAPVAATEVRTVPAEATNDEPAGCAPAVVALGLCKSR
jgi:hypothetical protein